MKTDLYRLERISAIGHQLLEVMAEEGITGETVTHDLKLQWMVTTPLFNIGEQVNCLTAGFVEAHSDQPWSSIAGLRHRLVHNYEGTNWSMIGAVLDEEIAPFIARVDEILAESQSGE